MKQKTVLVLDFGGQYASLIARRVRECGVYCEIHPYQNAAKAILSTSPYGIILSGGPQSVYANNSPRLDLALLPKSIPVLGICYGAQLIAHSLGGKVLPSPMPEYGLAQIEIKNNSALLSGVQNGSNVWMSHRDFGAGYNLSRHHRVWLKRRSCDKISSQCGRIARAFNLCSNH